jgi:hypothetical protein
VGLQYRSSRAHPYNKGIPSREQAVKIFLNQGKDQEAQGKEGDLVSMRCCSDKWRVHSIAWREMFSSLLNLEVFSSCGNDVS